MTTAAADPIFLDTNILVYASVDASPSYHAARDANTAMRRAKSAVDQSLSPARIFGYVSTSTRCIPITELTAAVRQFAVRSLMAENGPLVTAQLLTLLEQGYSTQVQDTNIVATMQAVGVGRILTNNPA